MTRNGPPIEAEAAHSPSPPAGSPLRGRVTLQILADHLAVSTATVSLALRGSPLVAEATRLRVQQTARTMGYSYNRSAASLRTDRTNILGVGFHDITNPYFAELLAAIEETAAAHGRSILLATYGESLLRQERALSTLKEYRPDGMIICAAASSSIEAFAHLTAAGVPMVQLSREIPGLDLDFVGSDDRLGTILAMEHLIGLGHRRIAFLSNSQDISTGRNRYAGYCEVQARQGWPLDPTIIVPGYGTRENGLRGIQAVLDVPDPPTAAICFNDLTAFGAMLGLRHRGREAGVDFSLVGCDDVQEAGLWYPALTTIKNFQSEMGRKSAEFLIHRIANPDAPTRRLTLKPELVIRATTAPPRA